MAVLAHACAEPRAQGSSPAANNSAGPCKQRVIVTFASVAENSDVAALAASTGAELNVLSRPLPTTYVLDLAATVDCGVALTRLRNAAGVRAAEPGVRRRLNQG